MIDTKNIDFAKGDGLVPAVIQDANNYQVLMLGYMNREALQKTLEIKQVTFYSRSKERLWTKGETSGNYLQLIDIQSDCDNDTLLVLANPKGPTCHTGEKTCFFKKDFSPSKNNLDFLNELESLIQDRKKTMPEDSYTSSLFARGIDIIAQKVGEEAVETVIESKNNTNKKFTGEVADLLFHLMVLLVEKDTSLKEIVKHLEERHAKK